MKKLLSFVLAISLVSVICSCDHKPETLVDEGFDEEEMDAAIARARSEVESFIIALEQGKDIAYAVKAPIQDGDETEHFWLTDIVFRDDSFEGVIGNDPGIVTNVEFGQKWSVSKGDISDWMFIRNGKMHGNYTIRPLLETMPAQEADMWRSRFAYP